MSIIHNALKKAQERLKKQNEEKAAPVDNKNDDSGMDNNDNPDNPDTPELPRKPENPENTDNTGNKQSPDRSCQSSDPKQVPQNPAEPETDKPTEEKRTGAVPSPEVELRDSPPGYAPSAPQAQAPETTGTGPSGEEGDVPKVGLRDISPGFDSEVPYASWQEETADKTPAEQTPKVGMRDTAMPGVVDTHEVRPPGSEAIIPGTAAAELQLKEQDTQPAAKQQTGKRKAPKSGSTAPQAKKVIRTVLILILILIIAGIARLFYLVFNKTLRLEDLIPAKEKISADKNAGASTLTAKGAAPSATSDTVKKTAAAQIIPARDLSDSDAKNLKVNGITMIEGKRVALINGEIYEEGSAVQDFLIKRITLKKVILYDNQGRLISISP